MIIGLVLRKSKSDEGHSINYLYSDIINALKYFNVIPIGIILDENYKDVLNYCDGVIFQGGDNISDKDLEALKYLYDINKPTLGICLGMQEMGILFNGKLGTSKNHKKKLSYAHSVMLKKDSKLYNIFNKKNIKVNSRHNDYLINTDLDISGVSSDNTVEAIEDKNKKFFVGVQWHPESMIEYDKIQVNIFKHFIESCKKLH